MEAISQTIQYNIEQFTSVSQTAPKFTVLILRLSLPLSLSCSRSDILSLASVEFYILVFTRATHLSRLHFRNNSSLRAEACRTAQVAPPVALSQSDKIANNGTKKRRERDRTQLPNECP